MSRTRRLSRGWRIGVVERGNSDDDVDKHAQHPLKVVALPVTEEVSNDQYGKNEHDSIEGFEPEVHRPVKAPTDKDDERGVEQGGLDRRTHHVRQCEVHSVVPGLVDGCEVLGEFLDKGDEDETEEPGACSVPHIVMTTSGSRRNLRILDVSFVDDELDLLDQEHHAKRYATERDDKGDNTFSECQLVLPGVPVTVLILLFVAFEHFIVHAVVRAHLEPNVAGTSQHT